MGQVIELRGSPANPAVVDAATHISREAQKGMRALMYIGVDAGGEAVLGFCGEFSDDLEYAAEAASEGFSRLIGHKIEQQAIQTPPRLRKA